MPEKGLIPPQLLLKVNRAEVNTGIFTVNNVHVEPRGSRKRPRGVWHKKVRVQKMPATPQGWRRRWWQLFCCDLGQGKAFTVVLNESSSMRCQPVSTISLHTVTEMKEKDKTTKG